MVAISSKYRYQRVAGGFLIRGSCNSTQRDPRREI
jgi:hypothetical protein